MPPIAELMVERRDVGALIAKPEIESPEFEALVWRLLDDQAHHESPSFLLDPVPGPRPLHNEESTCRKSP